jgi:hypothetical protein
MSGKMLKESPMRAVRLVPWLMLPLLAACGGGDSPPAATTQAVDAPAMSSEAQPQQPAAPAASTQVAQAGSSSAGVAATALPAAAKPLIGSWAQSLEDCGNSAAEVVVTPTTFESPGRSCSMALNDNGDGTFALACGKETIKMTPVFTPTGEGITLAYGDGSKQTVLSCQ